ncbi:photosystem I assembly protein Ycf3 [mine drainage metagenome]|uniref:Photosystem I assembly protein Ycf3 n=1 Tax=mine drainage metagenome TaxID=410659 RepID=A0A1J5Q6B0_9ZZZZ
MPACQKAFSAGEYAQAVTYAKQALAATPDDRDAYLCLGRAQGGAGDHAAAIAALQAGDKLSKTPFEHVIALTLLGNQYKSARLYPDAIATYRQSLAIAHADKNRRYEMIDLNLIGESLQGSGDFKGAIDAYQQGYKLAANDSERADSHAHMASVYSAQGMHDQAIEQQLMTSVLEERVGDLDHIAYANLELARIYLEANQPAAAEKTMNNTLPIVMGADSAYWVASVYQMQGRIKYAEGKAEEGRALFQSGIDIAKKIGADDLAKEIENTAAGLKM